MLASNVSLGALRLQAQQRADLEGSPQISTPEWNQYISQSQKSLFNKLIACYGNDYYVAPLFQFTLTSEQYYTLPNGVIASNGETDGAPALYKLLGVDLQYSASPTGWVTLKRFEEIERNKYAYPNTAVNYQGYTNLKYRISGGYLEFIPVPSGGQTVQLKYIPKPPSLQFLAICAITLDVTTITTSDASDLSAGMSVYGSGIPNGTTIVSVDTTVTPNEIVLSAAPLSTTATATLAFWIDSVTVDGIAGWEEFIIIDAAIKANIKQEQPVDELRIQKAEMVAEIESTAEGRDAGQAHHVSDALSVNGFGMDDFGDGWGGGYSGY